MADKRLSVTCQWEWGCWMLGVFIDPTVIYTGDDGLRGAWDFDFALLFLMVQVRWSWLHSAYRSGEGILDAIARHEAETNGEPELIRRPASSHPAPGGAAT